MKPVELTDSTFQEFVSTGRVLVDCWAPWCKPCLRMSPVIDELARISKGRIKVGKLNVDDNPNVSDLFMISSIPTLLIFVDGELVDEFTGYDPTMAPKVLLDFVSEI